MKKTIFLILILLTNLLPLNAKEHLQHAKVTKVYDGDTLQLDLENNLTPIRLTEIDCFETAKIHRAYKQAYENKISIEEVLQRGEAAKKLMEKILSENNNEIFFKCTGVDKYKRLLGKVYTKKHINISNILLSSGYCKEYIFIKH